MLTDTMRVELSLPCALMYRFLEHGAVSEADQQVLSLLRQGANVPLRDLPPKRTKSLTRRCVRAEEAVLALFREPDTKQYIDGAVMGYALLLWLDELLQDEWLVIETEDWMDIATGYLRAELAPHWQRAQLYAPEFVPLIHGVLQDFGLYSR